MDSFFDDFREDISLVDGDVRRTTTDHTPHCSLAVIASMQKDQVNSAPASVPAVGMASRLERWISESSTATRQDAGLGIDRPPKDIHCVWGDYPVFYDFQNLDIALDELVRSGAELRGRLLDFGCSSGRNLAALQRAFGNDLELFGADPSQSSIEWLRANVHGVCAEVNRQEPPLPFEDATFDLVLAKSIWTHFSPSAARAWFREIERVMAPGGHFFFSTHGPHDIASRIAYNFPNPKYERFAGADHWTKEPFLSAAITGLRRQGYFFAPYKVVAHQGDIRGIDNAKTDDWGLMFMMPDFVKSLLPERLEVVSRSIARTGGRHDAYVVKRL
ncbi:class I SAM-dependent methyltransferase [Labrenzia sp. CE80]|uniref:class I SAM-dependent methyltransferase n=1 Tax=Labrenzia sp. CE80 TaxID=1788986 RepID=UPI00129AAE71|nr:class I SAM-dependent methyltransferase [Labrenzia sp. CE80]